ncbi:MAG: hypothetical protein WA817_09870 [Candidatus Acidiferrum sp.]
MKGNQDPLLITKAAGKRSSYQITDYVFCGDCEHRFNVNGEGYVMQVVAKQNLDFPLLETLKAVPPTLKHENWDTYSAADTPSIDREKLAYFATSVFWRASVHTWGQANGDKVKIDLGPKYNEQIRKYLLGETPMPQNVSLQVIVCSDLVNRISFFPPAENQKHHDRTFIFVARGVMFFFRVSNTLTGFQKRLSVVNNPNAWITIRDCQQYPVWRQA